MARETIASLKADLKREVGQLNTYHNARLKQKEELELLKKENTDLESRLAYADKVNIANIGMLNFLKGQVNVYERMTDTQECDCEDYDLVDNTFKNER